MFASKSLPRLTHRKTSPKITLHPGPGGIPEGIRLLRRVVYIQMDLSTLRGAPGWVTMVGENLLDQETGTTKAVSRKKKKNHRIEFLLLFSFFFLGGRLILNMLVKK